jgi:hypothetical protein
METAVHLFLYEDSIYSLRIGMIRSIGKIFINLYDGDKKTPVNGKYMFMRVIKKDTVNRNESIDNIKKNALLVENFFREIGKKYDTIVYKTKIWYLTYFEIYYEIQVEKIKDKTKLFKKGFALLQTKGNRYNYRKLDEYNNFVLSTNPKEEPEVYIEYKSIEKGEKLSLFFSADDARILDFHNYVSNNNENNLINSNSHLQLMDDFDK